MSFNEYQGESPSRIVQKLIEGFLLETKDPNLQIPDVSALLNISDEKKKINFLLLGKTGHGKSATGNSALGNNAFESKASMTSVTSEVQGGQVVLKDYVVKVIDSPGLVDTNFAEDKVRELELAIKNMEKAIKMCPEGIHGFLFVLKFGSRFTDEEQKTIHSLRHIFGHSFLAKRGIIVFTHGDAFEQAMEEENTPDKSFDEWCEEQTGAQSDLMKECDFRCVLFNNRHKDEHKKQTQIKNVIDLALIFDKPYTFDDFCKCKQLHDKLLVELKTPKLKEEFQCKINTLTSQMELACGSGNTPAAEFENFKQKFDNLKMEINANDKNTGLLNDLQEKISFAKSQIDHYKRRQDEAEQQRIENERAQREAEQQRIENERVQREAEARQHEITLANQRLQAFLNQHNANSRRRRHKDCSIQ